MVNKDIPNIPHSTIHNKQSMTTGDCLAARKKPFARGGRDLGLDLVAVAEVEERQARGE